MKLTSLGSILLLALSAGCASQAPTQALWQLQPVLELRHAGGDGRAFHELGRYYHGQLRLEQAENAYRQAIANDARLADAHSALGTLYAGRGEWERAEAAFRQALEIAPESAYLHNNLGYLLLLQGRNDEAEASLRRALAFDPGLKRALANLREIAASRSDETLAGEIHQRWHQEAAAPGREAAGEIEPMPSFYQESVTFEIEAAGGRVDLAGTPPAARLTARIELANGNGVARFARRFGDLLRAEGVAVNRITNHKPFTVAGTFVEYQPGHAESARALIQRIGIECEPLPARERRAGSDIRLVLGRDLASRFEPRG